MIERRKVIGTVKYEEMARRRRTKERRKRRRKMMKNKEEKRGMQKVFEGDSEKVMLRRKIKRKVRMKKNEKKKQKGRKSIQITESQAPGIKVGHGEKQ